MARIKGGAATRAQWLLTGCVSALLACTGGAIMIVQAAGAAGLGKAELISWFTSAYVAGGFLNILLTLRYKIPFAGAHSITATAFLGTAAVGMSYPQLAGAYVMSGLLLMLLGVTGWFGKFLSLLPKPLIDALLAGLLLTYVAAMVPATVELPIAGLLAGAGYFFGPRLIKSLPPALWALLLGGAGVWLQNGLPDLPSSTYIAPFIVVPVFSWDGLLSLAFPLALLILTNDLAVASTSLRSHDFRPPVNRMITGSGVASVVAGMFGGSSANVGGLMSALCSSPESGAHGERYKAALVSSLIVVGFGAAAWKVVDVIGALPEAFVVILTGFSLLGLFIRGVKNAFVDKEQRIPAFITFVIAVLHVHVLGIATPVWALLGGLAAMWVIKKMRTRAHIHMK
ncbi:benzoate/H(+) symporter BenE family transporter [Paenibacillus agaridevorans]|uniref:benzoate/H(+) symporter BenE family transporter n=1 Tax=Paenibacillus agaridevorans TaxID=171404 RepID=UPI001BE4E049|nr:benzoate/H(+) symporter BenE family transporter [Paenibacillus agaridevorans]